MDDYPIEQLHELLQFCTLVEAARSGQGRAVEERAGQPGPGLVRSLARATGHDLETVAWAVLRRDVPALFNLPPAPNGPGPAPGARLLGDCRVIDTEQRRAPDGGGA